MKKKSKIKCQKHERIDQNTTPCNRIRCVDKALVISLCALQRTVMKETYEHHANCKFNYKVNLID